MSRYARQAAKAATAMGVAVGGSAYYISDFLIKVPWQSRGYTPEGYVLSNLEGMPRSYAFLMGKIKDPSQDWGLSFDEVSFPSTANPNIQLKGWHVHGKDTDTCVITVHGAGGDRRDFLRHLKHLYEETGASFLMFDCQGHGASDGPTGISMGVKEHTDIISAVAFARDSLKAKRVILLGTSQGAAASVLAASNPKCKIDAAIFENPFANAQEVLCSAVRRALGKMPDDDELTQKGKEKIKNRNPMMRFLLEAQGLIPDWYVDLLLWIALKRMQVSDEHIPESAARNIKVPFFILHGTDDRTIPLDHAERIIAAAAEAPYVEKWYPNAAHSMIFNAHPDEFRERVAKFIRTQTQRAAAA